MSPESLRECPDCVRYQEACRRAIDESLHWKDLLASTPNGSEREQIRASYEEAEHERIAARDAFVNHRVKVHGPWERGGGDRFLGGTDVDALPENSKKGTLHKVGVRVSKPGFTVHVRSGYFR